MRFTIQLIGVLLVCVGTAVAGPGARVSEVQFSNEDYKQLDTFEGHRLTKADEVFKQGDFKRAQAEYDSFILEFPQSKALAYALLRKARCLHLDNKRFEAVKAYREVLVYFPNVVNYAAPALFYTGQAHWENNDNEKAVAVWAQMAADKEYSQHPLGAVAFNELGDYLNKQNKADDAVRYFQQVAVTFRTSNPSAATNAIYQTVYYLVRTKPDEPALRAFYVKARTFDSQPQRVEGDVAGNRDYWGRVIEAVKRHGEFPADQPALRERFFQYWADAMEGKFADWDDFQTNLAAFRLAHEKDTKKWIERLDKQFAAYQKAGDNARVTRWISLYREHKDKVAEYYRKYDFSMMSSQQIIDLMKVVYDDVQDEALGRNVFQRIPLGQLSDSDKVGLARYSWKKAPDLVKEICMAMQDKELGKMELLRYYNTQRDDKQGLPLAEDMAKSPTYSREALQSKADLLYWSRQYDKAVLAYEAVDNPPHNLWRIAECYENLGKIEQAIGQLGEVEKYFTQHSAEAALRIAHVYKRSNQPKQYAAALLAVLNKYPKSQQSTTAHQEREALGVRIGGGLNEGE